MGKRASRCLSRALCTLAAALIANAAFGEGSCLESPVFKAGWDWVGLSVNPEFIGDWRLNVSSSSSVLTRAHIRVQLAHPRDANWHAQVAFIYPGSPGPAVPYTFQKIQFQYRTLIGVQNGMVDWTHDCTTVGSSIFPGQAFSTEIELPETDGLLNLDGFSISLWGSEN